MAQQRRGRPKGSKNLKRSSDGKLVNQYGVSFSEEERRALESRVNAINAKRRRMLREEAKLPRKFAGKETGQTIGESLQLMGKESDFILAKKTKSLQRFRSREQFDDYLDRLERVNMKTYVEDRVRDYKRNHMQSLRDAYGDDAKDIIMKIRMMKPEDYMKAVQQDEVLEIGFNYPPDQSKLNIMRAALGMKLKDDDGAWDGDEFDE